MTVPLSRQTRRHSSPARRRTSLPLPSALNCAPHEHMTCQYSLGARCTRLTSSEVQSRPQRTHLMAVPSLATRCSHGDWLRIARCATDERGDSGTRGGFECSAGLGGSEAHLVEDRADEDELAHDASLNPVRRSQLDPPVPLGDYLIVMLSA